MKVHFCTLNDGSPFFFGGRGVTIQKDTIFVFEPPTHNDLLPFSGRYHILKFKSVGIGMSKKCYAHNFPVVWSMQNIKVVIFFSNPKVTYLTKLGLHNI